MSICNKCGGSGPFYPYRPRVCIECERARVRAYYEVNRERVQTTNRSYRKENLEQVRALDRRIARERNGSLERVAQRAAWIARNPEKARAQAILHKAVERKKIVKPTTCSKCGAEGRIEKSPSSRLLQALGGRLAVSHPSRRGAPCRRAVRGISAKSVGSMRPTASSRRMANIFGSASPTAARATSCRISRRRRPKSFPAKCALWRIQ